MEDETETYLRVLAEVTSPEGFIGLLHPNVTLDARGTDHLWRCTDYAELAELVRKGYAVGVRTTVMDSALIGNRMMLTSSIRLPTSAADFPGPQAGQSVWRVMTLCQGHIVHILDCAN
jgi:hypothetical protein